MKPFAAIVDYVRRERITAVMFGFLVAVGSISAMTRQPAPVHAPAAVSADAPDEPARGLSFDEDAKAKLEELQRHPRLIAALSLAITLVLLVGFLVQILFFTTLGPNYWRQGPLSDSPWGGGDVFKAFVVLFFIECVISVGGGFVLGFFPALAINDNAILMGTTFFRNGATALYVLWYVRRRYAAGPDSLGIHARRIGRYAGIGLLTYVGFLPVYILVLIALMGVLKLIGYEPPVQNVVEIVYEEQNARVVVLFGIFIAFIGPLFEELFFRGFIYRAFRKKWGLWIGIAATSLLFAVLHAHWVALAPIFALSAVLCWLFEKTGSIVPGATLHMAHNLLTLSLMLGIKYFQNG